MKKGYLYLVFITLIVVVVFSIALIFKLTTTANGTKTETSISSVTNQQLQSLVKEQNYDDSWVQKLSVEKNQKEYLYPTQKFYIEFN